MAQRTGGRHRAGRSRGARLGPAERRLGPAPTVAIALAGVAVLGFAPGLTPTAAAERAPRALAAQTDLAAAVYYLRGTNIGNEPTEDQYRAFIDTVLAGTESPTEPPKTKIGYPATIWPVSKGYLGDAKWNDSVAAGVAGLQEKQPDAGDVVFGFSQGAVVASQYKAQGPTGATYVLVENPNRPNGGVMSRFQGLTIPIMDLTFSGPTRDNGDETIDIARQYDGWADFPTYPVNLLADLNAVMGIALVHGKTQTELTEQDLADAKAAGGMYYQEHGNTTYYLVRTDTLPLLMPIAGVAPDLAAALDPPLRAIIETGYDRSDYSVNTPAKLLPSPSSVQHSLQRVADDDNPTESAAGQASADLTRSTAKTLVAALKLNPLAPQSTTASRLSLRRAEGVGPAAPATTRDDAEEYTGANAADDSPGVVRKPRLRIPKLPGFSALRAKERTSDGDSAETRSERTRFSRGPSARGTGDSGQ